MLRIRSAPSPVFLRRVGRGAGRLAASARSAVKRSAGLTFACGLLVLVALPLRATVITVDHFDSSTAEDGLCTLREAIAAANSDLPTGGCPAGSGPDTIVLTGDVELTVVDSFGTGLPRITSVITLRGRGHTVERNSATEFRLFWITEAGDLTVKNLTATGGGGVGFPGTGGAYYCAGSLTLSDSVVAHGIATRGGAIETTPTGTLRVFGSAFVLGQAYSGGAIYNAGTATIVDSTFALNTAGGTQNAEGGAIFNVGQLTLKRSLLDTNQAVEGGAIANYYGRVSVSNTTISGNIGSLGGGVFNRLGVLLLDHTTITGNQLTGSGAMGGGVATSSDGGTTTLKSSIIADNQDANCSGSISPWSANLADDTTCTNVPGTFDLTRFDSTLRDNGGPTQTHALLAGSDAIGADNLCDSPTDQRGALRHGPCDFGAYEFGADDRHETSGSAGGDDTCFGHRAQFGRPERHLHTSDFGDWVRFRPLAGSTYEVETSRLIGGSDTVIELWRGCDSWLLENDDLGATDLASRLSYTASQADEVEGLDILVRDLSGAAVDRGYDVTVRCVSGACAACAAGGGRVFELLDEQVVTHLELEACDRIEVRDTTIEPEASAILSAGESVAIGNGFTVGAGSSVVLAIDPDLG